MFTGIIQKIGSVECLRKLRSGAQLTIRVSKPWKNGFVKGESISVSGVCLTVTTFTKNSFSVEAIPETLNATTLGELKEGDLVNLERSLRLQDSLGGHFVFGHVDTKSKIVSKLRRGTNYLLTIAIPKMIRPYLVPKGSIAVDGISLTIQSVKTKQFTCAIIPHTAQITTIHKKQAGDPVNLEADMMVKHLIHHLKVSKFRSKQ